MKQARRRKMKRRFLPKPAGENISHMTKGCRKILNYWVKGTKKKANILNTLLTKRVD
jgi:hypothetical protein